MHTAICSFNDRAAADRARDRLIQSGFDRSDVHVEHRAAYGDETSDEGSHDKNDRWDAMEREVAVSRTTVKRFGHFFSALFGKDHPAGHTDTYSQHVERGNYVVVVDGHSDSDAMRAQSLLREMEAGEMNVVNREGNRPLRDIVAERGTMGAAGMRDGSSVPYESTSNSAANLERERAMASGTARSDAPRAVDSSDDLTHAPGLRYSDKDKPLGS